VKYWQGRYVVVYPRGRWTFRECLCCGRALRGHNQDGYGPTCGKGPLSESERRRWRERALADDRERYRREVLAVGLRVE